MRIKKNRQLTLIAALISILMGSASINVHASDLDLVNKSGQWLTDTKGRVVTVHGFNLVQKVAPYDPASMGFDDNNAAFLAQNGYTVVRLGIMWKAYEPKPGQYNEAYLDSIVKTVNVLADHGIYSLIDFHQDNFHEKFTFFGTLGQGFPDWAVLDSDDTSSSDKAWNAFWENKSVDGVGLQERYAEFWRRVAARFIGNSAVLGYDLMNEPRLGNSAPQALSAAYDKAVSSIQAIDSSHMIFWENPVLPPSPPSPYTPPTNIKANINGLSYHNYGASLGSAFGGEIYRIISNIIPWFTNFASEQASNLYFAFMWDEWRKTGAAPLITEFGSIPDVETLQKVAEQADANRVGWIEWTYHRTGSSDFSNTPSIVNDLTKPLIEPNVNQSVLESLTRPYPVVIAGTPDFWSYDRASKKFNLRYTINRVDGTGNFDENSTTTIILPKLNYPTGYKTQVSGGIVTSFVNADRLTIRPNSSKPTSITVTVLPN
ncbi:cellulase family glycosylhydrolase [Burkholderia sp. TSV86]|uniref:cellulase family glycosylhydrolase n=1 Tax=Burkholderia sp. TSV86 TaxID=1385594 RepID=UPI0009EB31A4|nr:cellulase family glycosylhydrolase [Burkholderia sp. TSV86]